VRNTSTTTHKLVDHWLMLDFIERRIRLHTQRLYDERGHADGRELEDWLKATAKVLLTLNTEDRPESEPAKSKAKAA